MQIFYNVRNWIVCFIHRDHQKHLFGKSHVRFAFSQCRQLRQCFYAQHLNLVLLASPRGFRTCFQYLFVGACRCLPFFHRFSIISKLIISAISSPLNRIFEHFPEPLKIATERTPHRSHFCSGGTIPVTSSKTRVTPRRFFKRSKQTSQTMTGPLSLSIICFILLTPSLLLR